MHHVNLTTSIFYFFFSHCFVYSSGQGDRHYIRLLLCHVAGAKGYEDLRTHEGTLYPTFRDAAAARGLLDDDAMHWKIMSDAALCQMPRQLRHTFALLLMWDPPVDPAKLWDEFADDLAADFVHAKKQASFGQISHLFALPCSVSML